MGIIIAGILASSSAWLLNRLAIKALGPAAIIYLIPLLEEAVKTLWAFYWGIPIFFTHLFFGGVEAIYDLETSRRNGFWAGLTSFFSHLVFGLVAMEVYSSGRKVVFGILASYVVHMLWNLLVMKILVRSKERG